MHPPARRDRDLALDGLFEWIQRRPYARVGFVLLAAWGIAYTVVFAQAAVWWITDADGLSGIRLLGFAFSSYAVVASLQLLVVLSLPAAFVLSATELRKSVRLVWIGTTVGTLAVTAAGFVSFLFPAACSVAFMVWARRRYPLVRVQEEPWSDLP